MCHLCGRNNIPTYAHGYRRVTGYIKDRSAGGANQLTLRAEGHLAKAEGYLAKGDAWYAKAADEIIAAQKADTTLSNREIAARFDKGEKWVRSLVQWRTTSSPETPIDWGRGSHATAAEIQAGAEKLLKTAPLETVEHQETGELACEECISKARSGISSKQESLL